MSLIAWVESELAKAKAAIVGGAKKVETEIDTVAGLGLNAFDVSIQAMKTVVGTTPQGLCIAGLLDDVKTYIDTKEPAVLAELHAALATLPAVQTAVATAVATPAKPAAPAVAPTPAK